MKTSDSLSISPNRQQANVVLEMKVCKETAKKKNTKLQIQTQNKVLSILTQFFKTKTKMTTCFFKNIFHFEQVLLRYGLDPTQTPY